MPRSRHQLHYILIGLRLRAARKAKGMTQHQVAVRLREQQTYVSKCERAERRVDIVECYEFAKVYGIDVLDLLKPETTAEREALRPYRDAIAERPPVDDDED